MSESEFMLSDAYRRSYSRKLDEYEYFIVDEVRSCSCYPSKQIEDHLKERYDVALEIGFPMDCICAYTPQDSLLREIIRDNLSARQAHVNHYRIEESVKEQIRCICDPG